MQLPRRLSLLGCTIKNQFRKISPYWKRFSRTTQRQLPARLTFLQPKIVRYTDYCFKSRKILGRLIRISGTVKLAWFGPETGPHASISHHSVFNLTTYLLSNLVPTLNHVIIRFLGLLSPSSLCYISFRNIALGNKIF